MKAPSASANATGLITRQSMLVLLSAGAFFICGSYVIDGFGHIGSAGEPHSFSRHLNSRSGQYAASTDTGDENGYSAENSPDRLSDSAAGYVFAGSLSPCWHSGHCTGIPVNPFKYESYFGFSPLRSPPLTS